MNEKIRNVNPENVDDLLGRFFHAEMPDPWPACQALALAELPRSSQQPWYLSTTRWILAASILLFFLGYFTLAGLFPKPTGGPLDVDHSRDIGNLPGKTHKLMSPGK